MADTRWLDTVQVAAKFQVPQETIRYWRHIGYGPKPIKLGRHVRYREDDWDAFAASCLKDRAV
jgi:DNA-binding transcriptional MerR regulator